MRPLKLGILGTGIAANKLYLPAFKALGRDIELLACANRTRSKALAFAKAAGVAKVLDSGDDLLAQPDIEAVLISLPIDQQPAWVLKALRAGKHVLSEKPMAPDLAAGRALLRSAAPYQRQGLKWLVGENFHFMRQAGQLQAWLEAGALGDVRLVEAHQMGLMDASSPYFHTAWRTSPRFVGGFVVDGGVHLANILRRSFGLPVEVKRLTGGFNPALPPLDTVVASLRFASGALGQWTSCFSAAGNGPIISVRGSKANVDLYWHEIVLSPHRGKARRVPAGPDSFQLQFRHFAQAVVQGQPLGFSPAEALADLAFMQGLVHGKALRP
jgi:predicted dehydrogenase